MYCDGYDRLENNTCITCQVGYYGPFCTQINCGENGTPTKNQQCKCKAPFSGQFCDHSLPNDVYLHFNQKVYQIGPIGAVFILPMLAIWFICQKASAMKVIKRVKEDYKSMYLQDSEESDKLEELMNASIASSIERKMSRIISLEYIDELDKYSLNHI
uniref:EGF-like domain-containing protein n=1 Tax=Acrobeloides nanus TaxID=290746 RepID=A0A914C3C1_9BILA